MTSRQETGTIRAVLSCADRPGRARAMRCRLGGSPAGHDFRDTPAGLRLFVEHLHDTVPAVGGSKEGRGDVGKQER
jgi:hypothetical protein